VSDTTEVLAVIHEDVGVTGWSPGGVTDKGWCPREHGVEAEDSTACDVDSSDGCLRRALVRARKDVVDGDGDVMSWREDRKCFLRMRDRAAR